MTAARFPRVYLAGPFSARESIAAHIADLRAIGYECRTRWLDGGHQPPDPSMPFVEPDPFAAPSRFAGEDLEDIEVADLLIMFTPAALGSTGGRRGGRHVETGYAMALRKPVVIVGQAENVFHEFGAHNGVHVVPDWHAAVVLLAGFLVNDLREMPTADMVEPPNAAQATYGLVN